MLCVSIVDMRKIGSSRGAVTAYPRQLESLIRLAEAHAKMRSDFPLHNHTICLHNHTMYLSPSLSLSLCPQSLHLSLSLSIRFSSTVEIVDVEEAKR